MAYIADGGSGGVERDLSLLAKERVNPPLHRSLSWASRQHSLRYVRLLRLDTLFDKGPPAKKRIITVA